MKELRIKDSEILAYIKESFKVSPDRINKIISNFHSEMAKGLAGDASSMEMIPTFVEMPNGQETGNFIALDLGGTNFRVQAVALSGKGRVRVTAERKFVLRKEDITGTGKQLFDFIADSIKGFMHTNKISRSEKRNLGFTFSFPVEQSNIADGRLLCWNKGFSADNVIGVDVVKLLNAALKRKRINNIKVAALLNDTVGTLVTRAYSDRNCDLGVILGTGTNACYPEKIAGISKWRGLKTASGHMIINMEWGNFNKMPRTFYDEKLDKVSSNPGRQRLEKMVSGYYLGEVTRLILCDLVKRKMLFRGNVFAALAVPYSFKTEYMSYVIVDNSKKLDKVRKLLEKLGIFGSTYRDRKLLKKICKITKRRSACISAAAIAAALNWIDPGLSKRHTIAIDGSLFAKSPGYDIYMIRTLRNLFGNRVNRIKLVLTKDGSGKGAAIVAAIATRM